MSKGSTNWTAPQEMQYMQLIGERIWLGCYMCARVFKYQLLDSDTMRLDAVSNESDRSCFHAVLKRIDCRRPLLLSPLNVQQREWEEEFEREGSPIAQPDRAANRGQPIHAATNQTSVAAGSDR